MIFTLVYEKGFLKDLDRISNNDVKRILPAVKELARNPLPKDSKKLKSDSGIYRIRQGNYRIIYEIDRANRQVRVLCARHRKDVYKNIP